MHSGCIYFYLFFVRSSTLIPIDIMGKQSSSGSSSRAKGVNARRARKQQDQSLGQAYTALSAKRSNQRRLALKLARRKLAKVEEKLKWHVVEEGNKEQAAAGKALRKERNGLKRDLALALVDDGKEEQAMPLLEDLAPKSAVCRDELLILYIKESKIDEALALLARSSPPPSTATKFSAFLINYLQKFIFTAETSDSESAAAAAAAAPVSDAVLAASFAEATEWNPFAMLLLAFHPLLRSDQRIDPDVVLQLVRDASAEHGEPHAPRGVNEAVLFAADALSYWRDAEGLLAYARKGIRDLVSSRSKEPKSKCGGQNARSVARLCAPLGKGEEGGVPALLRVPEIHTRRHLAQVFGAIFDLVHSDSASDEVFDDEGIGASGAVDGPLSVENLVEFYKKHDPSKAVPSRCRQLLRENTLEELMSGQSHMFAILSTVMCCHASTDDLPTLNGCCADARTAKEVW